MDMITACAMQASAYMHRTGTTAEQMAGVSVKNHGNALKNPIAQLPMKITVEDVLQSEMIADPLHKLDCSPVSDACCAIIIASESSGGVNSGKTGMDKRRIVLRRCFFLETAICPGPDP